MTYADAITHPDPHGHADDAHGHGHDHPPHLAHHFDSNEQQVATGKMGMWAFLGTEILMFGGLFCAYFVWRAHHFEAFQIGHLYLDKFWGAVNTVILIASSFTMAWAVRTAQLNKRMATVVLLGLTFLGGCGFMIVKYMEYSHKYHLGVFPGKHFYAPHLPPAKPDTAPDHAAHLAAASASTGGIVVAPAAPADAHAAHDSHDDHAHHTVTNTAEDMAKAWPFFSIYFVMTGLHGIHVLVGMGVILWILIRAYRGEFNEQYNAPVDLVGLYWHLVDLIWIFLFPLLYLI